MCAYTLQGFGWIRIRIKRIQIRNPGRIQQGIPTQRKTVGTNCSVWEYRYRGKRLEPTVWEYRHRGKRLEPTVWEYRLREKRLEPTVWEYRHRKKRLELTVSKHQQQRQEPTVREYPTTTSVGINSWE